MSTGVTQEAAAPASHAPRHARLAPSAPTTAGGRQARSRRRPRADARGEEGNSHSAAWLLCVVQEVPTHRPAWPLHSPPLPLRCTPTRPPLPAHMQRRAGCVRLVKRVARELGLSDTPYECPATPCALLGPGSVHTRAQKRISEIFGLVSICHAARSVWRLHQCDHQPTTRHVAEGAHDGPTHRARATGKGMRRTASHLSAQRARRGALIQL